MKTHRFMALLCAGIMALNSAGGQVIHSYAAEAREIVQEQSESAAFSETEASDFIVEASDPAAGEEIGAADPDRFHTVMWRDVPLSEGDNEVRLSAGGRVSAARWRLGTAP